MSGASQVPGSAPGLGQAPRDTAGVATEGLPTEPCPTFERARERAVQHMEIHFPLAHQARYAAWPTGRHNSTHWHVRVDEARYLQTGDRQYMLVGPPEVLVDKATGEVTTVAYLSAPALFAGMAPAHEDPAVPAPRGRPSRFRRDVPRPVPVWLAPVRHAMA